MDWPFYYCSFFCTILLPFDFYLSVSTILVYCRKGPWNLELKNLLETWFHHLLPVTLDKSLNLADSILVGKKTWSIYLFFLAPSHTAFVVGIKFEKMSLVQIHGTTESVEIINYMWGRIKFIIFLLLDLYSEQMLVESKNCHFIKFSQGIPLTKWCTVHFLKFTNESDSITWYTNRSNSKVSINVL